MTGYTSCSISGLSSINNYKYDNFIVGFSQSNYVAVIYFGNSTIQSRNVVPNIYVYSSIYSTNNCNSVGGAGDLASYVMNLYNALLCK